MERIKIAAEDRVITIKDGNIYRGTVKKIFELDPPVLMVEFDDGNIEKISLSDVALEPKPETPEKNEPVEKSEITITPGKFREIVCRVIAEENINRYRPRLAYVSLMGKIHKALFVDAWEND